MSSLKRPVYSYERKGRHRNRPFEKEWTLYDGLKY